MGTYRNTAPESSLECTTSSGVCTDGHRGQPTASQVQASCRNLRIPYSTRREERVVARSLATRGFGLASSSTTSQSARSAAVTAAAVSRKREILNCRNQVTNHLILVREITHANSHRGEAAGDEGGQKNQGPREAGDERSPKGIEARTKPEEPTLSRKGVQGEIQRHPQATGWTHNGKDRQETTTNFGQQKHQQARGQPTT